VRVPPGSTVRILDAEAGRAQKGGEGSYFRSEGGGEGLFRGAKPPPNSCRFRGRFGPGADFAGDFGAYFGAPLSVEGGRLTRPRLPPLSSLPWRRAANPAPNVPPVFATVGSGPDCTGGAFGPRKGGYPLSHVPYSSRRTGTSPFLRAPRARGGLDPVRGPGRYPRDSRPPLGPLSDSQGGFLGCPKYIPRSRPALFSSEAAVGPQDHECRIRPAASLRVVLRKQRVVTPGCTIIGDEPSNDAEAEPADQ
jgi:hypothetical protein